MKRDPRVDAAIELDELFYGTPGDQGLLSEPRRESVAELTAALQQATKLLSESKANLNQSGRLAKDIRAFLDSRHKAARLAAK